MNEDMFDKFYQACVSGNINDVRKYIQLGVDVNLCRGDSYDNPLYIAFSQDYFDILELLLKSGARLDISNIDLQSCIALEFESFVFDVESGILDEKNSLPDVSETELLIKYGIDINSINKNGKTPLDIALKYNHVKAIGKLKSLGAKTSDELKLEGN